MRSKPWTYFGESRVSIRRDVEIRNPFWVRSAFAFLISKRLHPIRRKRSRSSISFRIAAELSPKKFGQMGGS